MKDLIIVGAGGFGREVFHWLQDWLDADRNRSQEFQIKGFFSFDENILDDFSFPVGILGHEETYQIQPNDRFVMGIGRIDRRKVAAEKLIQQNARFFTLVHPTAKVASSATLGDGTIICPFVLVSSDVSIGRFSTMNIYSSAGHDAVIGDFCLLSPYSTLNGFARLDDEVYMGTHSTVTLSKTVGAKSRISANSLVVSNVPPATTVLGTPGKMIPNLI